MPIINTLSGRSTFSYRGNIVNGAVLEMRQEHEISAELFNAIMSVFANASVRLGASMTTPIPGGLGEWVACNSQRLNRRRLTPRHASFIAAILVHEGYATFATNGNSITLTFPMLRVTS